METGSTRRTFLSYLVSGTTLAVATQIVPHPAEALPSPQLADLQDLGDILVMAGAPTQNLIVVEVDTAGKVHFALPREEVGQGITTAFAMLIAEELAVPLADVVVTLADARPELLFNQLTGGSNTMRSMYAPVRRAAAVARTRLVAAAAKQWGVAAATCTVSDGVVHGPNGQQAGYGALSAAAADPKLSVGPPVLKDEADFTLVGTPTNRIDARRIVTGQQQYTMDLHVPGALPTVVRRPPSIGGMVKTVNNVAVVRAMPGVVAVATVPTGVAVVAETFGQAFAARDRLDVSWTAGTVDSYSDTEVMKRLKSAALPFLLPPLGVLTVGGEFEFASVSHAALETNTAIADVRAGRAEIWSPLKSPITAQFRIAQAIGLPQNRVTVHPVQGGGSFGRRLFWDAALEAAQISKAVERPVKLMWSRVDDMRHGRVRPASFHRIRATHLLGGVLAWEHRTAFVETDFGHGLGDALSSVVEGNVIGAIGFSQFVFNFTVKSPYNFGVTTQVLNEVPLRMPTGAFRSVYSANTRGSEEIIVDELAKALRKDPVAFRLASLKTARQRAVLSKVAAEGQWGRTMPAGHAQGVGFHDEYQSCTACLVEVDARDPAHPRVTKAVIAVDVGTPVNPRGLQAQMMGGLIDAISLTFTAGLHLDHGLPLEGSYSQFHYARQRHAPLDVQVFVMPANGKVGGAGELGLPAAVGAVANAYARATGTKPRRFPLNNAVDFVPFPR